MKTTTITSLHSIFKKYSIRNLCWLFFAFTILVPQYAFTQSDTDKETLAVVTKYTSRSDRTAIFLNKIGYTPPAYLKNEWNSYPAVKKLAMAYEAAELGEPGKGGKKLIQKLNYELQGKYEGIRHEPMLKGLQKFTGKITFKHPTSYGKINLENTIKKQLLTLSKYTEKGALGGNRGILLFKYGLKDIDAFDILAKSKDSYDALARGLQKSKIPPTHKERLKKIIAELQTKYEGARYESVFKDYTTIDPPARKKMFTPKKITQITDNIANKAKYTRFFTKSYIVNKVGAKFKNMMRYRGGFGGIIFGNTLKDSTGLQKLSQMQYISSNTKIYGEHVGSLEFVFENEIVLAVSSVFAEDVVAAHQIVSQEFDTENGTGLVGIHSKLKLPNNFYRFEVIVHPAIANLNLGWAALITDIFPLTQSKIINEIEDYSNKKAYESAKIFFDQKDRMTYKIIDVPLTITRTENQLELYRNDFKKSQRVEDTYITMHEFIKSDSTGNESTSFYNAIPFFKSVNYEINRLNQFAKILALFRWAKQKGIMLKTLPKNITYVETPTTITLNRDGIKIH